MRKKDFLEQILAYLDLFKTSQHFYVRKLYSFWIYGDADFIGKASVFFSLFILVSFCFASVVSRQNDNYIQSILKRGIVVVGFWDLIFLLIIFIVTALYFIYPLLVFFKVIILHPFHIWLGIMFSTLFWMGVVDITFHQDSSAYPEFLTYMVLYVIFYNFLLVFVFNLSYFTYPIALTILLFFFIRAPKPAVSEFNRGVTPTVFLESKKKKKEK